MANHADINMQISNISYLMLFKFILNQFLSRKNMHKENKINVTFVFYVIFNICFYMTAKIVVVLWYGFVSIVIVIHFRVGISSYDGLRTINIVLVYQYLFF